MSRIIDTVTVDAIEDRRLVLSGAAVARTLPFGSTWNTLRIGIRMSMGDYGASLQGTPRFYLGVMGTPAAGLTNGPLSDNTAHFVGIRTNLSTLTRTATPPHPYYSGTMLYGVKRIGSTETLAATPSTWTPTATPSTGNFRVVILEIVKGSPNFTFYWVRNNIVVASEMSLAEFKVAMNVGRIDSSTGVNFYCAAVTGGAGHIVATTTLAVSEADGALNSIVCAWDKRDAPLYLSDFCYSRRA